ncbi:hypothetical protein BDW42DRAFT_190087 [Aspergillus taichungensis]|uniref:Extracellular membrane protein CFEM domain-containing protein n=1 Tax=Aspergillus taichungensis TaxID=482145 RepID=A0A2J5I8X9_9EURO|nr:hypothetical protein BDW42DRAFT_190087 [Aspergillus taichungensis]
MRFLPIAVVGLASVATAAELKSWDDIVGDIPTCIKKCMNDFYTDSGVEKECGAPDKASIDCLCQPASYKLVSSTLSSVDDLQDCLKDSCSEKDLTDSIDKINAMGERAEDFQDQCEKRADSKDDDSKDDDSKDDSDKKDDSDSKDDSDNKDDADSNGAASLLPCMSKTMLAVGAILVPVVL